MRFSYKKIKTIQDSCKLITKKYSQKNIHKNEESEFKDHSFFKTNKSNRIIFSNSLEKNKEEIEDNTVENTNSSFSLKEINLLSSVMKINKQDYEIKKIKTFYKKIQNLDIKEFSDEKFRNKLRTLYNNNKY